MDILITETSIGGIGFETAKQLLELGHRVYIVNRIQKKTEDTVKALMRFGKVEKAGYCMDLEDFA